MKKATPLLIAICTILFACNDAEQSDAVDTADSANEAKIEGATDAGNTVAGSDTANRATAGAPVNEETADFFVKAANGGMAEVAAGKMAQEKATNPKVKEFAGMMVTDHTGANAGLKELASKKNVTLPDTVSNEKKEDAADLAKKTGKDFDKAYMKMQVADHENTVDLFEKGAKNINDTEVKTYITTTLPKLKAHLEAARTLNKSL